MEQKFASVQIRETREKLFQALNESGLPGSILQLIISDVANAVNEVAEKEYQSDVKKMAEEEEQAKETAAAATRK